MTEVPELSLKLNSLSNILDWALTACNFNILIHSPDPEKLTKRVFVNSFTYVIPKPAPPGSNESLHEGGPTLQPRYSKPVFPLMPVRSSSCRDFRPAEPRFCSLSCRGQNPAEPSTDLLYCSFSYFISQLNSQHNCHFKPRFTSLYMHGSDKHENLLRSGT